MGRRLRFSEPWQVLELTARTIEARFLLSPDPTLSRRIIGVIAKAKEAYGLEVYAVVVLSNHLHLLFAAPCTDVASRAQCFILGNIARETNHLRERTGPLWHRRGERIPVLDDLSAERRLRYILSNGCKEGLVGHPEDWPGVQSATALCTDRKMQGEWVDRTSFLQCPRRDKKLEEFIEEVELELDPLPHLKSASREEYRRMMRALVEDIAEEAKAVPGGSRRTKRRRLEKQLAKRRPEYRPKDAASAPAPRCHGATEAICEAFEKAYDAFVEAYWAAAEKIEGALEGLGLPQHGMVSGHVAGCT